MRFRFSALLCLASLAGCSHSTNSSTAKDPAYANEPSQVASDPSMTPASLEQTPPSRTAPAADEAHTTTNAPLVADTKGAGPNVAKSPDDAPKAPSAAPADAQPDNTKVNQRDTNGAALTPMDQSNSQTDLKITQQIRQAVMADGTLSFTAKNVKIITQGGKVTLRGPVKSEQERSNIEAAARKVAGVAQVDNQLEVKK
jgi:hyperosmotically inducible protein